MDLAQTTTDYGTEDRRWLHGWPEFQTDRQGVTLDGTLFAGKFPDGVVPSGVVLGKVTATGLYGPYDDNVSDGRQVAEGFLFTTLTGVTSGKTVSGALWYGPGRVMEAFLPTGHGLDANAKSDLPDSIRYDASS